MNIRSPQRIYNSLEKLRITNIKSFDYKALIKASKLYLMKIRGKLIQQLESLSHTNQETEKRLRNFFLAIENAIIFAFIYHIKMKIRYSKSKKWTQRAKPGVD